MVRHKYTLEPYKGMNSRYDCPSCGEKKEFTRYINIQTGECLDPLVGMCNNAVKCGYHKPPRQFFNENPSAKRNFHKTSKNSLPEIKKPEIFSIHIPEILEKSLKQYDHNNLVTYLGKILGKKTTQKLVDEYLIGTSNHWPGASVFWQIDRDGKIKAGKIMLIDKETGKRVKKPYPHINWVHSVMKIEPFNLKQCFFGENLVNKYPGKPVAIVESEKTAVICSFYSPQMVWLAAGNLNGLTLEKCKALQGKRIFLFPDLKCFEVWKDKAKKISAILNRNNSVITTFTVSDLLEKNATAIDRERSYDMADYLTRINQVIHSQPGQGPGFLKTGHNLETYTRDGESWTVEINEHDYPASWDK